MIGRLLEQEKAIRVVLGSDRDASHLLPTWQDIDVWNAINEALPPLEEFTNVMSGEKYVTGSAVLPIMDLLDKEILKEKEEDKTLMDEIRLAIKADLFTRNTSAEVFELLELCSFVDPRFKTKYLKDDDIITVKALVCDEAVLLYPKDVSDNATSSNNLTTEGSPKLKRRRTLGSLFKPKGWENTDSQTSVREKVQCEIATCLKVPKLDTESDPLEWWKLNESGYPGLAKVAKKYLVVPATSAPSERLFSKSGKIVNELRASLKPDKVEMLTFLARNI